MDACWRTLGIVNQRLLLQCKYLAAENRILRSQLPARLRLSNEQRSTLAEIGKRRGRRYLVEVARVAKPATILASIGGVRLDILTLRDLSLCGISPEDALRSGHPEFESGLRSTSADKVTSLHSLAPFDFQPKTNCRPLCRRS
jgi:hypothetical protein